MPDRLSDLREQLLSSGLSPRHVDRYCQELADHRDDLADNLEQAGLSAGDALVTAERRLGTTQALLLPMLADRRFRSPAARWPALAYVALPLACQLAFAVGSLVVLAQAASRLRSAAPDLGTLTAMLWLAAPVVIAWVTLAAARRRRTAPHWPVIGAMLGATLPSVFKLSVVKSGPTLAGEIALALVPPSPLLLTALIVLSLLPLAPQLLKV